MKLFQSDGSVMWVNRGMELLTWTPGGPRPKSLLQDPRGGEVDFRALRYQVPDAPSPPVALTWWCHLWTPLCPLRTWKASLDTGSSVMLVSGRFASAVLRAQEEYVKRTNNPVLPELCQTLVDLGRHARIIRFHGRSTHPDGREIMVTEFARHGSLDVLLERLEEQGTPMPMQVCFYC